MSTVATESNTVKRAKDKHDAQDFLEDTRHASFEERSILKYVSTAENEQ